MDDLMSKFSEVILQTFAAEARLEEEFKKCTLKLDEHITQSITNGTPVQNKKRPKRLDSLDDADGAEPEHDDKSSDSRSSSRSSHQPAAALRKNSVRQKSLETAAPAAAPELEESTTGRPARSARVKAIKNLKEPTLNSKMRQPSMVTIKQERISMEVRKERNEDEPMDLDVENDGNVLNGVAPLAGVEQQKKSSDEGFGSTNEKEDAPVGADPSREMSIMVIPQPIPKVEVLSDDEAAEKMPPPMMPPPSKPAAKSKAKTKKVKNSDVFPVPIKREKDVDDSALSSAESTLSNASSVRSSSTRAASKKKKDSTQAPIVNIKKEKISTGKTKGKPSTVASPTASEKSVYEDAIEGGDSVMKPLVIGISKMPLVDAEKNQTFAMDKNGTFTTAANGTFVVPSPNGTFNVKSPENNANATFDVRPPVGNSTFVMDNKKGTPEVNASIMTEDNSLIEPSPEKPPVVVPAKKPSVAKKPSTATSKSKKNNELFSLQSPIKSRIEAFEKAAVASPMHTRTGTTTSSKHTTPSQPTRLPSKTTTPLTSNRFPSSAKAASQHTPTAQNTLPSATTKGISASASKLAHLQKKPATSGATTLTKSQSLSREPSMERQPGGGTLSAASSSSSLAVMDEKKKKREEKQRLAQQQREQMEKEKREHAEKLMREKEEKHRKLVQEKEEKLRAEAVKKAKKMEEFEKRRHLEELNQRMLAEQKREELAKLEQQQRAEQADLFKMNQAKENYEIKLHKQMYQQKMQQQQKLAHAQQLQQQQQQQQLQLKKLKEKQASADKEMFTFDMILTDDSTDDESSNTAPSKQKKRPPLPSWCSKEERRQPMRIQAEIKLKVIDQFFSVAPMTPDLREIFPAIDARKLKRNSSAVWRTPPRYSQMPKY